MKILGCTNRNLKIGRGFYGGDGNIIHGEGMNNELEVGFCAPRRYQACLRSGTCEEKRPQDTSAKLHMVGKRKVGDVLTTSDLKKVEAMLRHEFKKCRAIEVEIKESQS